MKELPAFWGCGNLPDFTALLLTGRLPRHKKRSSQRHINFEECKGNCEPPKKQMKIISLVGARPQFIKAAPVGRALRAEECEVVLVHTGQHYDNEMSAIFFRELEIPKPDYNLGVGSGSHGWQTGQMLIQIEEALLEEKPDWMLVYGDTNSTLAGALAAAKLHVPVAHVEAGLRSYNRRMPEEINRVLTDHASDLLFCPTQTAVDNLTRENITRGVHNVGDVMYDAVLHNIKLAKKSSKVLEELDLEPGKYLLATVHRPVNTDNEDNLRNILMALNTLNEVIVFPAHPRVRKAINRQGLHINSHIQLIKPVGYLDMLTLEKAARMILTDSGGVQKEAYWLGVPCVTLREETEWVETVQAGWNVLVGPDAKQIIETVNVFQPPRERPNLFGDGRASQYIAASLVGSEVSSQKNGARPPRFL